MARVEELAPGQIIERMILARRVAIVNDNGTIRGIQSECAHMRASLAQGGIQDFPQPGTDAVQAFPEVRFHGRTLGLAHGVERA